MFPGLSSLSVQCVASWLLALRTPWQSFQLLMVLVSESRQWKLLLGTVLRLEWTCCPHHLFHCSVKEHLQATQSTAQYPNHRRTISHDMISQSDCLKRTLPWLQTDCFSKKIIKIGSTIMFSFLATSKTSTEECRRTEKPNLKRFQVLPHLAVSLVAAASCVSYKP